MQHWKHSIKQPSIRCLSTFVLPFYLAQFSHCLVSRYRRFCQGKRIVNNVINLMILLTMSMIMTTRVVRYFRPCCRDQIHAAVLVVNRILMSLFRFVKCIKSLLIRIELPSKCQQLFDIRFRDKSQSPVLFLLLLLNFLSTSG